MSVVTLSTGEKVSFRDKWTHRMEKDFDLHLFGEASVVTAKGLYAAYEHVFGLLIERIDQSGQPVPYGVAWLDALPEEDYKLLQDELLRLRKGDGGEKKRADP